MKRFLLNLLVIFFVSTGLVYAENYVVDVAHSQVGFNVKHLMLFNVHGSFKNFEGTITADPVDKTVQHVEATIQVDSIDTRIERRDGHLKSPDFFDAGNYPTIHFVSTAVSGSGMHITVQGDLTMRGVTRSIRLRGAFLGSIEGPGGKQRAGFRATAKIKRMDYGIAWNKKTKTGDAMVGDEVELVLEIESIEQ